VGHYCARHHAPDIKLTYRQTGLGALFLACERKLCCVVTFPCYLRLLQV